MKYLYVALLLMCTSLSFALGDKPYNSAYDPKRDVFADFAAAKADAKAGNKLVLLEFGGDWCIWCHQLDKFIAGNPDVSKNLSEVFIVVKVNVSEENGNEDFLKQFSKVPGYPHFIVTNSEGEELGAINTAKLEKGKSYSAAQMQEFIETWRKK